jgi:hypothetical protein
VPGDEKKPTQGEKSKILKKTQFKEKMNMMQEG